MPTYTVHFRNDQDYATRTFKAGTPAQALADARAFYEEHDWELQFVTYDSGHGVNEILVEDRRGAEVAVWRDEDLWLRLAAAELLDALKQALAALNAAPRFAVPGLGTDSYAIAALCDRAIALARPPAS